MLKEVTSWMQAPDRSADQRAAGATPYLRLFATILGGFLLVKAEKAAVKEGAKNGKRQSDSAAFYIQQILPPALGLLPAIKMGHIPDVV